MMPYADRLAPLRAWFAQLWAESLGKDGQGTAPIAALGPVDQHSQLQLFMDGPHEHLITHRPAPDAGAGPRIAPETRRQRPGSTISPAARRATCVAAQAAAVAEALAASRPAGAHLRPRPA